MASHFSLQLLKPFHFSKSLGSKSRSDADVPSFLKLNKKECRNFLFQENRVSLEFLFAHYTSSRCVSLRALSSGVSSTSGEENDGVSSAAVAKVDNNEIEFNRINCLVWVLHESAASFSLAVQSLGLPGSGAELAMAWNGKDVHEWHKIIAYQVAAYALLKTAIEVESLLSLDRHHNASLVKKILTPKINLMEEYIEGQLKLKHEDLVEWFRVVELPHIAGFFIPLLKKWSMEYAGSGVAGIIVAISCCAAVGKLGSRRISCPMSTSTIDDVLIELMDLSHSLVEVEKLHQLAIEAGFELNFLSHFGAKVLPCNEIEELEFWIGLAQRKLSVAFSKETIVKDTKSSLEKVQADSLATLGLFAYLGRKTRLFLSRMSVKDLDELVKDFLDYLECSILFIYPEFASVSAYECFMEVVNEEIGWLDFYATCSPLRNQERKRSQFKKKERKRSKQHPIQAEKEIILSTVFTVCYDVFSGFAHFSRSTQQPLDAESLEFLLRSQSLLTVCLEDYRAVYDRSCELRKIADGGTSDHTLSAGTRATNKLPVALEVQQKPSELMRQGCLQIKSQEGTKLRKEQAGSSAVTEVVSVAEVPETSTNSSSLHQSLLKRYGVKLASTSSDVWMGTQLLFVDIIDTMELLLKQMRGHKVSRRERRKLKRTLNDIATLIPITILMLLPVSAVGHAAMLAAIKKYVPNLIPSPYSSERLEVVKQLNRAKKMEIRSWSNLQDPSSNINLEESSANPTVQ
ncbi:uncharacterized protein LOC8273810 isoform X2 [Ricinus communis]|uniref:uncharacterized protein LOC8273810 isoform X2 n=1 Tax=Ricinus communis TaxID=3988 RepID=UPI00077291E6|nr:uncharacterized protein LOC8273810 isoform X2 [Ricinus communis]|eukprot:XP_015572782.1 uncharacterized protein LOC8273810 isoform X2 [Ricinus communis]